MNRKDFIKGSCGVCMALSSGFVMSALLSSCHSALSVFKTTSANNTIQVPLSEFEKSSYKLVRVNNYNFDLAVQKKPDGTFDVLVLECTHAGQPLTKTGNTYYCTLHGSQYSHDGKLLKGPAETDMKRLAWKMENNFLTIHLI